MRHRLCRGFEHPALPIVPHNQMSTPENAVAWSRTLTLASDGISLHQISDESSHQAVSKRGSVWGSHAVPLLMHVLSRVCHLLMPPPVFLPSSFFPLPSKRLHSSNLIFLISSASGKQTLHSLKGFSYSSLNHTTSGSGLTNTRYVFRRAHRGDPGPQA